MPTTTNSTTQAIIDFIKWNGGAAWRINVAGIPVRNKQGQVVAFRKSKQVGMADIRIVYNGYSIDAEVKTGRDTQSPEQWAFQQEVERAGGQYWLVSSSAEFIEKFEQWRSNGTTARQ